MPSIKDLKKRITTVKNTQQTTRAMKMVSAAKLRRAQDAIQSQRPYAKQISGLISRLLSTVPEGYSHPLLRKPELDPASPAKRVLMVVLTSDRGLCAGFNTDAIKTAQQWLKSSSARGTQVEFAFVGRRGYDFFKTKNVKTAAYYSELGGKVSFAKAKKLAENLVQRFLNQEVDEIKIIYNEFKNAVSQTVVVEDFLPLQPANANEAVSTDDQREYIVRPNREELLKELLQRNFAVQTFRILLESQAGEHGARMSAMENATKNAGEMIRKLTLQYNKQRQAGITKELLEIISGSESQKR